MKFKFKVFIKYCNKNTEICREISVDFCKSFNTGSVIASIIINLIKGNFDKPVQCPMKKVSFGIFSIYINMLDFNTKLPIIQMTFSEYSNKNQYI